MVVLMVAGLSMLTLGNSMFGIRYSSSQSGYSVDEEVGRLKYLLEQEMKEKERLQNILEAARIKTEEEEAEALPKGINKGQGTKSQEEPSTRTDLLEQRVCIDIKKFNISSGRTSAAPSPTCKSWFMEGAVVKDEDGYTGDIFFPPNRKSAMKQFQYLNDLILEFLPSKQCRAIMSKGPLRAYRRSDMSQDVLYPAMWGDELEMLFKTLINLKPRTYYEWGAGGSSRWLAAFASEMAVSVDNYKPWCEKVASDPLVSCLERAGIYKLGCFVPEGQEQQGWGRIASSDPGNDRAGESFINSIDRFNISRYDAILVDGRFRQACALKALNYIDSERSIVMFHDFWSRWEKYDFVLKYYNPIGRSRTIGILRRKPLEELPDGWRTEYKIYSTLQHQA